MHPQRVLYRVKSPSAMISQQHHQQGSLLTVLHAIHLPMAIHNRHPIIGLPHLTRRSSVRDRVHTRTNQPLDLLVRLDAQARVVFVSNGQIRLHSRDRPRLTQAPEHGDGDLDIRLRGEPIRVDQRRIIHAGGSYGQVASRCRRYEGREKGSLIVVIGRLRRCRKVSDEEGKGEVLDFWPIFWEGCKSYKWRNVSVFTLHQFLAYGVTDGLMPPNIVDEGWKMRE